MQGRRPSSKFPPLSAADMAAAEAVVVAAFGQPVSGTPLLSTTAAGPAPPSPLVKPASQIMPFGTAGRSAMTRPATAGAAGHSHSSQSASQAPKQLRRSGTAWGVASMESDEGNSRAVSTLEEENEVLKEELRQMKEAFVDKLRGSNKFVSGGQFRSAGRGASPAPTTDKSAASTIATLKADRRNLSAQVAELQRRLQEAESRLMERTPVSDSDFLRQQLAHAQATVRATQDALDSAASQIRDLNALNSELGDKSHKDQKEIARLLAALQDAREHGSRQHQLQAELSAALDANDELRTALAAAQAELSAKPVAPTPPSPVTPQPSISSEALMLAHREAADLKAQLASVRKSLDDAKHTEDDLRSAAAQLERKLAAAQTEKRAAQTRAGELEWELAAATTKAAEAGLALMQARASLEQAQAANSQCQCGPLTQKLQAAQKQLTDSEASLASANKTAEHQRALAEAATARVQAVQAEQKSVLADLGRHKAALEGALERAKQSELLSNDLKAQVLLLSENAVAAERTIQQLQARVREQDASHSVSTLQIGKLTAQNSSLSDRLLAAEAALAAAAAQTEAAVQRMRTEILEKSLQSMVRLCVVAPTVNVQIGSASEAIVCKPGMPRTQLRSVIEAEVLPQFVSAFVQQSASTGPDGSPLNTWLRTLATDMQRSIEKHLHAQFSSGAGGGGSGTGSAHASDDEDSGKDGEDRAGSVYGVGEPGKTLLPASGTDGAALPRTKSQKHLRAGLSYSRSQDGRPPSAAAR